MPRKKQKKLDEARTFKNIFDYKDENVESRIIEYLGNDNSVTIELCCGQADYSISLAAEYSGRNFIGIDRKPARLWNASINAASLQLKNVSFLIAYAEKLDSVFKKIKAEEIWITFPDPYPRRSSMKKRLVHPRFLDIYKKFLVDKGKINLKTDDDTLFNYTLKVIENEKLNLIKATDNLYKSNHLSFEENIKTKYEKQHIAVGKPIKLVSFSFS